MTPQDPARAGSDAPSPRLARYDVSPDRAYDDPDYDDDPVRRTLVMEAIASARSRARLRDENERLRAEKAAVEAALRASKAEAVDLRARLAAHAHPAPQTGAVFVRPAPWIEEARREMEAADRRMREAMAAFNGYRSPPKPPTAP